MKHKNRLTKWIHKIRYKRWHKRRPSHAAVRYVDMNHDEQVEAVKQTMQTVNYDGHDIKLTDNELTIVQCALSVYLNLLRGHYDDT